MVPVRRWVDLSRYDGAAMHVVADWPSGDGNRLVVRGYGRSDLSQHGFDLLGPNIWGAKRSDFRISDLRAWFPGFDPARDIADMEADAILIGYEDLDLEDATLAIGAAPEGSERAARPTVKEQAERCRRAVDPAEVAAVVASYAREDAAAAFDGEVPPETRAFHLDYSGANGRSLKPGSATERIIAEETSALAREVDRYNQLLDHNVYAVSDFDIVVPYGEDALQGLKQSLRLVSNHILYFRRKLKVLNEVQAGSSPSRTDKPEPRRRVRSVKSETRQRARIEDTGEKIGGARKDFHARALSKDNLAQMNEREKSELVTRDNVWPHKSLSSFRDEGVDCRVALFVSAIRRDLPAKTPDATRAASYVELVSLIRDCAVSLSSPDQILARVGASEISQFETALAEAGVLEIEHGRGYVGRAVGSEFRDVIFADPKGRRFATSVLFDASRAYRKAVNTYYGFRVEVDGQSKRSNDLDSEGLYDFIEKRLKAASDKRNATRAATGARSANEYLSRPHLDQLRRENAPDERGDRNVSPEDFLESFGFRACEFGNWLPDAERQDVLNRAFDSLCTLARVMKVEKRFLSLDGTLALAFGSRGVGRALAHYEPARKVINLTRLKGAGSLAHEFWHGLDDHMGEYIKRVAAGRMDADVLASTYFASEMFLDNGKRRSDRRQGVSRFAVAQRSQIPSSLSRELAGFVDATNAMTVRNYTAEEVRKTLEAELTRMRYTLVSDVASMLRARESGVEPDDYQSTAEALVSAAISEFESADYAAPVGGARHPLLANLTALPATADFDERRPNVRNWLTEARLRMGRVLGDYPTTLRALDEPTAPKFVALSQRSRYSRYVEEAVRLDGGREGNYWSSVRELSARAFESYVQDRCAELGWRDDYLVHGTDAERFDAAENSPYPRVEDRPAIRKGIEDYLALARRILAPEPQEACDTLPASRFRAA